jgi:hypothetical protein
MISGGAVVLGLHVHVEPATNGAATAAPVRTMNDPRMRSAMRKRFYLQTKFSARFVSPLPV